MRFGIAAVVAVGLAVFLFYANPGATADKPTPDVPPGAILSSESESLLAEACPGTQKAIGFYRRAYTSHREAMGLAGAPPRRWYPCEAARRRAVEWRDRATIERAVFVEWNSSTGRIVRRLDAGLAGTPMAGLGRVLEAEGREHGISPFFMAGAAGTESSFGAASCSNNPRNVWGLAACDGRWHVPYFETWEEAVGFYARFLADRWPSASTPYEFYGYAACDACWGRKTSQHMGRFGVGNATRYEAVR